MIVQRLIMVGTLRVIHIQLTARSVRAAKHFGMIATLMTNVMQDITVVEAVTCQQELDVIA